MEDQISNGAGAGTGAADPTPTPAIRNLSRSCYPYQAMEGFSHDNQKVDKNCITAIPADRLSNLFQTEWVNVFNQVRPEVFYRSDDRFYRSIFSARQMRENAQSQVLVFRFTSVQWTSKSLMVLALPLP